MKSVLAKSLLPILAMGVLVSAAQSGPFLVSTRESSKDMYARVSEDSGGTRELQVHIPEGGNTGGRKPETVYSEDVSARAFDADGKEMSLEALRIGARDKRGEILVGVCNAGSCNAIKIYHFSVPKAETDQLRKVIVVYRNKQYELEMEKYPPPKRAN